MNVTQKNILFVFLISMLGGASAFSAAAGDERVSNTGEDKTVADLGVQGTDNFSDDEEEDDREDGDVDQEVLMIHLEAVSSGKPSASATSTGTPSGRSSSFLARIFRLGRKSAPPSNTDSGRATSVPPVLVVPSRGVVDPASPFAAPTPPPLLVTDRRQVSEPTHVRVRFSPQGTEFLNSGGKWELVVRRP